MKKLISRLISYAIALFFASWMVMYAAPFVGHPLGYWHAVLITYAMTAVISLGVHSGTISAKDTLKEEEKAGSTPATQALQNYANALTKK